MAYSIYECPFCNDYFSRATDYRNHIRDCEMLARKVEEEADKKWQARQRINELKEDQAKMKAEIERLERLFNLNLSEDEETDDELEEEDDDDDEFSIKGLRITYSYDPDTNGMKITDIKEIDFDE